jgi:hypothetical protein
MLIDGLVALLNGATLVAAIVEGRIGPVPAPEDLASYPCIVYDDSYTFEYSMDGETGFHPSRVILECFGIRKMDARALAWAVRGVLSGFAGTLSDGTPVDSIEIASIVSGWEDGSRIYKYSVHALIRFSE